MSDPLSRALSASRRAGIPDAQFWRNCDLAAETGVLYIGPDAVVLAFDEGDRWFLWCAVGTLARFFDLAPYPRPLIAFARGLRDPRQAARTYPWDRLKRIVDHGRRKKETNAAGTGGAGREPDSAAHRNGDRDHGRAAQGPGGRGSAGRIRT